MRVTRGGRAGLEGASLSPVVAIAGWVAGGSPKGRGLPEFASTERGTCAKLGSEGLCVVLRLGGKLARVGSEARGASSLPCGCPT